MVLPTQVVHDPLATTRRPRDEQRTQVNHLFQLWSGNNPPWWGGEAVAPHGKGASPVPVPTAVVAIAYAAESSPKSDNVHPCQPGDLFYERYV